MLIPLILISILETLLYLSLPFFAVIAISGAAPTAELLIQIWCLTAMSFYAASLVPTPGNSGALETASTFDFCHGRSRRNQLGHRLGGIHLEIRQFLSVHRRRRMYERILHDPRRRPRQTRP